jgi:hypothetical protein
VIDVPRPFTQTGIWPELSDPLRVTIGESERTGPMKMNLVISLQRMPRQKCSACGLRRIGFRIGLSDLIAGPVLCAKDAGIR